MRATLPGMTRATAIVHCAPALGAKFTQYTAEIESEGALGPAHAQRFLYVLQGMAVVEAGGPAREMTCGAFAYLPENSEQRVFGKSETRLAVIEKAYLPVAGIAPPSCVFGHEASIASEALQDNDALQVQSLLPRDVSFDFAVNTMSYEPGASLSMVETHVMEHGLLMLQGEGIYRLSDCWYPVQAGDFIWMRAFCPQWFGALGKRAAKYLIYKDWNRSPLA